MRRLVIFLGILLLSNVIFADTLAVRIIYIGEIRDDANYRQTIELLESARAGDEVIVDMTSNGGDVDIGIKIAEAMARSRATVIYRVPSYGYSMAAMLVCLAPHAQVSNTAILMYHMVYNVDQHGQPYKLDPHNSRDLYYLNWANETFRKCGFLTEKEIAKIDAGGQVWLIGAVVNARLRHH